MKKITTFVIGLIVGGVISFGIANSTMYTEQEAVDAGIAVANNKIENVIEERDKLVRALKFCIGQYNECKDLSTRQPLTQNQQ